jgi:hypothetical protein
MHPLQGQVQPELPCPLSCGNHNTSKAKIDELPEKYIRPIRSALELLHAGSAETAQDNAALNLSIVLENSSWLFRGVIRHLVLNDLSALHYEFDMLKLGDVG